MQKEKEFPGRPSPYGTPSKNMLKRPTNHNNNKGGKPSTRVA